MDEVKDGSRGEEEAEITEVNLVEEFEAFLKAVVEFFSRTLLVKVNKIDGSDGRDIRPEIYRAYKYILKTIRTSQHLETFRKQVNKGFENLQLNTWPDEIRDIAQILDPFNLEKFLGTVICLVSGYTSSGKTTLAQKLAQSVFGITNLCLPVTEEESSNTLLEIQFLRANSFQIRTQAINRENQYVNLFNLLEAKPTWVEFKGKFQQSVNANLQKQGLDKASKLWTDPLLALYYLARMDPLTQLNQVFDTERENALNTKERMACLQNLSKIVFNIYSPDIKVSGVNLLTHILDSPGPFEGSREISRHNNFFIEYGRSFCDLLIVTVPNDMLCNKLETYKLFIDPDRHEAVADSLRHECYWAPWMYIVFSKYLKLDKARMEIEKTGYTHYFQSLEDANNYIPTRFYYNNPEDPLNFFDGRERTLLSFSPDCKEAVVPDLVIDDILSELKSSEPTTSTPPLLTPNLENQEGKGSLPSDLKVWGKIPRKLFIQDQVRLLLKYDKRTSREIGYSALDVDKISEDDLYKIFLRYILGIRRGSDTVTDQFADEGEGQFMDEETDQMGAKPGSPYRYSEEYVRTPKVLASMIQAGVDNVKKEKFNVIRTFIIRYMRPLLGIIAERYLRYEVEEKKEQFFLDFLKLVEEKKKTREGDIFDFLPLESEINNFFVRRHFRKIKEAIIDILNRAFDDTRKICRLDTEDRRHLQGRCDTMEYLKLYWKTVEEIENKEKEKLESRLGVPFSMVREIRTGIMGILDHLYRMMAATSPLAKTNYLDSLMQRHNGLSGLLDLDWPGMERYSKDVGIPDGVICLLRVAAAIREYPILRRDQSDQQREL